MDKGMIALMILAGVVTIFVIFLIVLLQKQKQTRIDSQRELSDRDLLRLIAAQPDGIVSKKEVVAASRLSSSAATIRLSSLVNNGVLRINHDSYLRGYYSLAKPLEAVPDITLSPEPFLTVDDILKLFEAFDYKLDYQKLILATGLPLDILKREMKYFEKEKIIKMLFRTDSNGITSRHFFILQEPYRSKPQQFLSREKEMNQRVKELLRNDLLI